MAFSKGFGDTTAPLCVETSVDEPMLVDSCGTSMERFQSRLTNAVAVALASTMLLLPVTRAPAQTPNAWPSNTWSSNAGSASPQFVYRLPPVFQSPDPGVRVPEDVWPGAPLGDPGSAMTLPSAGTPGRTWPNSAYPGASAYPSASAPNAVPFDDPFEEHAGTNCVPDPYGPPCPVPSAAPSGWPRCGICNRLKGLANFSGGQGDGGGGSGGPGGGKNMFSTPDDPLDDEHLLGKWTLMNFSAVRRHSRLPRSARRKAGKQFRLSRRI